MMRMKLHPVIEFYIPNVLRCQCRNRFYIVRCVFLEKFFLDEDLFGLLQRTRFVSREQKPMRPPVQNETQQAQRHADAQVTNKRTKFWFLISTNEHLIFLILIKDAFMKIPTCWKVGILRNRMIVIWRWAFCDQIHSNFIGIFECFIVFVFCVCVGGFWARRNLFCVCVYIW